MDLEKGQILPIGKGKHEQELIKMIIASGYKGKIGIIGHNAERDVKVVLTENLNGLKGILEEK